MGDEQKRYGATDDEIRKFCAKLYLRYGATDEDIVDWRRIRQSLPVKNGELVMANRGARIDY